VAGLAVVGVLMVAGCGSGTPAATPGVVRVTAAENFWGDIASQIGGSHVTVTSIISNPNTDPHLYESDPQDSAAIDTAQLVIANGLGYDDFVTKTLAAAGSSSRRVLTVQKVLGVTGSDANPHLWYWTSRLPTVAAAIAAQLTAIDPADSKTFAAGAKRFDASLKPLLATIAQIRKKYAGTPVGYTERVPGYLLAAAGLTVAIPSSFAQAIEDGNDPSPVDTATFDSDLTGHKIAVLLYNAQVVDAITTRIRQLAVSSHVPVIGVTETLPSTDANFQAWQLRQDRELLQALGGGAAHGRGQTGRLVAGREPALRRPGAVGRPRSRGRSR
jgi:zinc/manganese transport system substrate-binding protein